MASFTRAHDSEYIPHRAPPPLPTHNHNHSHSHSHSHTYSYFPPASARIADPPPIGLAPQQLNTTADTTATRRGGGAGIGGDAAAAPGPGPGPGEGERRRRGSLSRMLWRSTSNTSVNNPHRPAQNAAYTEAHAPPPLPNTLISRASVEASASRVRTSGESSYSSNKTNKPRNMLRKSSKAKALEEAAERERQARFQRPAPQLSMPAFGDDAVSNDLNHASSYARSNPQNQPPFPRTTANFSRPAAMAPASDNTTFSSSPAYTARPGIANSSSPAAAVAKSNGEYVAEPAGDRSESMTHRGRYSYASSAGPVNVNSPRRVRRRKDPTPFNVLVIGAKNSGKTSFISFLRHWLALPSHKQPSGRDPEPQIAGNRSSFNSHYLETEIEGERVGLTLWDSAGFEKNIVDLQLREMTAFVESKFEDTFMEEQKVMRSPGVKDTHIHCVFLILDPVRLDTTIAASSAFQKNGSHEGSLDNDLDLQVLRALWGKTTVIPVISKADTLTVSHMTFLKRAVSEALRIAKVNPLEALELEEDEEDEGEEDLDADIAEEDELPVAKPAKTHRRQTSMSAVNGSGNDDEMPYIPMSILSPDPYDLPPYTKTSNPDKVGRKFAWGFADPYNPEHCDFGRLRDSIFQEWRSELRELSRSKWYENWRTSRLKNLPGQRQRVKGGVTPLSSVPREGRMGSASSRQLSSSPPATTAGVSTAAGSATSPPPFPGGAVPRVVSVNRNPVAVTSQMGILPASESARNVSAASQQQQQQQAANVAGGA